MLVRSTSGSCGQRCAQNSRLLLPKQFLLKPNCIRRPRIARNQRARHFFDQHICVAFHGNRRRKNNLRWRLFDRDVQRRSGFSLHQSYLRSFQSRHKDHPQIFQALFGQRSVIRPYQRHAPFMRQSNRLARQSLDAIFQRLRLRSQSIAYGKKRNK